MENFDYKYVFDDIIDGFSKVSLYKQGQNTPAYFEISINDSSIRLLNGNCLSPRQADLLDLATAINFADKLALPEKNKSIRIHLHLPVRHPRNLRKVEKELQDLLFWYTNDCWFFFFFSRNSKGRLSENHIRSFGINDNKKSNEIALWSGGLDSLAGLQSRLLENPNKNFTLIGTGSNTIMSKTQQQLFQAVHLTPHASGRLRFLNIPVHANYRNRYSNNRIHRARGVVFLLIGATCAISSGLNKLHVYENGVGAINIPLPGGVGRDHSKAVHPQSLIFIGDLVSKLVQDKFSIENPFLFSTKAEMCMSLLSYPHLIFESISCDRLHREKYIQCGFCSSCILRRQAISAAGIKDKTKYVIPHGKRVQSHHLDYWNLMNCQINEIDQVINSFKPWLNMLLKYSNDIPDIVSNLTEREIYSENEIREKLTRLYRTHVREWRSVEDTILTEITMTLGENDLLEDEKWHQMNLIN